MKPLIAALLLALVAAPAMAGDVVDTTFVKAEGVHAFDVRDLVMMDRVSDPQLSPDGRHAAFGVRSTDYDANKGVGAIYVLDLDKGGQPVKVVEKGSSARWSADGRNQLFVARFDGKGQLTGEPCSAFALIHSTGEGIEIAEMTGGDGVHDRPVDGAVAVYGDVAEADRFA